MTSSAVITLHLSPSNEVVALPSGPRHEWAATALELAGFSREHPDDAHRLSLTDHAQARAALTQLHRTARNCQAEVITSERPYFGDIAHAVARKLPGQWDVSIEHYPDGSFPETHLNWVWEASPVLSSLTQYRVPGMAVISDGGGTELLLAERPWDGRYLIGALVPSPDHLDVVGAGPRTVIAATAHGAAADVCSRLLPEFEQLVHLARLREVQDELDWVRAAEPGTVDAVELESALDRFLTHAPHLIETTRRAGAKTLTASEAAVLVRFENLLARALADITGNRDVSGPGAADEALALWLEAGGDLLDAVRTATVSPAEDRSRPAITAATPPKTPSAVAAGRTR